MPKKRIILIGATGSIGRQTLEVVREKSDLFEVVGLVANQDKAGLLAAAENLLQNNESCKKPALCLSGIDPHDSRIEFQGTSGMLSLIENIEAEIVVNGASGSSGLGPSLKALESGKNLALANKESVVMGFGLLRSAAQSSGRMIIPVDSEHAALFQLIARVGRSEVEELIITASGGAFRNRPIQELALVTADDASHHPNWKMGRKISIDSATMANKGLEVIEAVRLFDFSPEKVKVLVHPQSLVHALVRSRDGSLYANLSEPDMRLPILNALTWPQVLPSPFAHLELSNRILEFQKPNPERYPLLGLAYFAASEGEGYSIAFNAADEIAVSAFETGSIDFLDIAKVVARTLEREWPKRLFSLEEIMLTDMAAREIALTTIKD